MKISINIEYFEDKVKNNIQNKVLFYLLFPLTKYETPINL
jgi:hypothetical protein